MSQQTKKFLLVLLLVLIVTGALSVRTFHKREQLIYRDSLDLPAVTVDQTVLTMRDIAFYIAYEEKTVEEQARVYSLENTSAYWKLHTNGSFVKLAAKDAVIDMAVHDFIFYQMAVKEKITLNEEEQRAYQLKEQDFWSDLTEEQIKRLGISESVIQDTMYKMAIAQKYQRLYANKMDKSYGAYDISGKAYEKLREDHTYQINKKDWDRIDFGNITIDHSGNTDHEKTSTECG